MVIAEIENLLKKTIGMDTASVGLPMIERAVRQRIAACGLRDLSSYLEKVRSSATEFQELVEAVVVSETWFFRDQEAFVALGQLVVHEWLPTHSQEKLRLLSVPCATGEEPYSLAMTLDGVGLTVDSFQIDAVDISNHALTRARKAIYGRNSFRGKDLEFRDRYFETGPHEYHLQDTIRRRVVFQQGNLLDPDFLPGPHSFHFIFCRNLLIYLDQSAQDRAIQALRRLMAPEGLLFVGPAEAALMINYDFVSARRPLAFAFRKTTVVAQKHPPEKKASRFKRKTAPSLAPVFKPRTHLKTQRLSIAPGNLDLSGKTGTDLKLAGRLANEGRLEEAVKICENYLKKHRSSVEALYLLGVVCDAMGEREKATAYYRKVLYLEPEHYESLMHLAYSAENGGDIAAAQNLRSRAQRVKERGQHA